MSARPSIFYSLFLLTTILSVVALQTDAVKADEERDERRTEALLTKLREVARPVSRPDDLKIALDNYKKGDSQTLVPILAIALEHENASVRSDAARILETLGDKASGATPALMKALNDSNENVQQRAMFAFKAVTGLSKTKVEDLQRVLKTLKEEESSDRGHDGAIRLLNRSDIKVAKYAVLQFSTLLEEEKDIKTKLAILSSVNEIVKGTVDIPQWGELFSALSRALKDKDSVVRRELVYLLKKMIDEKKAMDEVTLSKLKKGLDLPSLVEALKDSSEMVRNDALAILRELRKFFGDEINYILRGQFEEKFQTGCPVSSLKLAPEVETFVQDVLDATKRK